jgi:hypothetical protein
MILSERILGTSIVKELQTRTSAPLLKIGRDQYTRIDFATVACFNFQAAINLSSKIQEFNPKDTKDLFNRISPTDLAMPGLGAISIAVLGAAFQHKHLGGDSPLESWASKHQDNGDRALVSFGTIKHRSADIKAERDEKRQKRQRRQRRRDQAHEVRVERFEHRQDVVNDTGASK